MSDLKRQFSLRGFLFSIALTIYIGAVGYLCFANFNKLPDVQKFILGIPTDKIVHFVMFFPFPILAFLAYDRITDTVWKAIGAVLIIASIGCIFAGLTEIVQGSLPYRSQDISDFAADCISIVLSSAMVLVVDILTLKKK